MKAPLKVSVSRGSAKELIRNISDVVKSKCNREMDVNALKDIADRIIDDRIGVEVWEILDNVDTKGLQIISDLIAEMVQAYEKTHLQEQVEEDPYTKTKPKKEPKRSNVH